MKGVAMDVSPDLKLFDLTQLDTQLSGFRSRLPPRANRSILAAGAVFVSVVDPGVGTTRKSVVLKTNSGHFIATPDNGTLTLVAQSLGIAELREIDENVNQERDLKDLTLSMAAMYTHTLLRDWQLVSFLLNKWDLHYQTRW